MPLSYSGSSYQEQDGNWRRSSQGYDQVNAKALLLSGCSELSPPALSSLPVSLCAFSLLCSCRRPPFGFVETEQSVLFTWRKNTFTRDHFMPDAINRFFADRAARTTTRALLWWKVRRTSMIAKLTFSQDRRYGDDRSSNSRYGGRDRYGGGGGGYDRDGYNRGGYGSRSGFGDRDGYSSRGSYNRQRSDEMERRDEKPRERPRLQLQPRQKPLDDGNTAVDGSSRLVALFPSWF